MTRRNQAETDLDDRTWMTRRNQAETDLDDRTWMTRRNQAETDLDDRAGEVGPLFLEGRVPEMAREGRVAMGWPWHG